LEVRGGGGEGGGGGQGGEMTQTMYAHVNKLIKKRNMLPNVVKKE
jgi:GTPase involved in cell partitioning and DNA repair